jgi:signal transduction histidine kinase
LTAHGFPFGKRQITLRRWVPYGLFLVACALSVYAAHYVAATAEERRQDQFVADAQETRRRIEARLETYVQVVRDGTALLAASNEIHLGEFRAFVRRLELAKRYPGIEAIGFTQRVPLRDLRAFARAIELDGVTRFRVRPEGSRPEYQTVVFLEPMDAQSRGTLGYDLAVDPVQREAMDRARDTGQPALAGGATDPFNTIVPDAVILYVPVYRNGVATQTIEDRRRALYGFVFSPIRAGMLLEHAAAGSLHPVTFEVYDGTDVDTATMIFESASPTAQPEYESSGTLSVGGQQWRLVVKSVSAVPAIIPRPVRNTLLGGLLFSFILFVVVRVQIGAWETAKRHEAEIRASEQVVRASEARLREALAREQEARAAAQAADRAKDDFLVSVSHELLTPISAMLGWLSMMKTGAVREDRREHALEVVERNARLQARLIEDLLDVSRILLGRMSVDLQPVAVAPAVLFVADSLRPTAQAAGVDLHTPVLTGPGMIRGDVARVQQIVWNLVSNAIKFTPAGGEVSVELTDDGVHVVVRVRDTGIGIAPEFLPHVFDRFSQAAGSSARASAGLGLGMAITKHLTELHGGTITVHSDGRDRGALFVVSFPSAAAATAAPGRGGGRDAQPPMTAGLLTSSAPASAAIH